MMKDEAPYLLEWFAHHMAVGFTDILVYTNDCSDGTDTMLMRLEELGLAHHRVNDIPEGRKPQPSAIKYAQDEPVVQHSDWVLLFDADEFLCIKHGDGSLDGLIDAAGSANGIVITWRIFGSNGQVGWSNEPVTEQYTSAAPADWNKGWGVKTLFKFDADYWKLGIHRPKIKNKHLETGFPDSVHWLNGSGLPMEEYFKFRGWRSIRRTVGYDWAQINHYAIKSVDAYAIRKFRGNVNNKADKYNSDYWALQDRNEVSEKSILRYSEKRAQIVGELLKDPVLKGLHDKALERVDARLNEFRSSQAYTDLVNDLNKASETPISELDAKPPKARDPKKIAALMSRVEKRAVEKSAKKNSGQIDRTDRNGAGVFVKSHIDLTSDLSFETVSNHGVLLPADPRIFNQAALQDVISGKFERRTARHYGGLFERGERVLHLGAGIGFLPIMALNQKLGIKFIAHEEREELTSVACEIASANGLGDSAAMQLIGGSLGRGATGLKALVKDFNPTAIYNSNPGITGTQLMQGLGTALRRIILPEWYFSQIPAKRSVFEKSLAKNNFILTDQGEKACFLIYCLDVRKVIADK